MTRSPDIKPNENIKTQEDALFERWRCDRESFSPDGLADEATFLRSRTRIILLMKEVNDPKKSNFDLRDFLRRGGRSQTWDMVTRWVKGIRALEDDSLGPLLWPSFKTITSEERRVHLRSLGAVNLKKAAGGHTANNRKLEAAVEQDSELLDQQLRLYGPHLYISCGSMVTRLSGHIPMLASGLWRETSRGVRYRSLSGGGVLLAYSHPEARVSNNLLFYGLVDAVREILFMSQDKVP